MENCANCESLSTISETISLMESYELPAASKETLGGIYVGEGLSITDEGVLSAPSIPVLSAQIVASLLQGQNEQVCFESVNVINSEDSDYAEWWYSLGGMFEETLLYAPPDSGKADWKPSVSYEFDGSNQIQFNAGSVYIIKSKSVEDESTIETKSSKQIRELLINGLN